MELLLYKFDDNNFIINKKRIGNQDYNVKLRFDVCVHRKQNKVKMDYDKFMDENKSSSKSKRSKKKKSKPRSRSSSENENKYDNYLDDNLKLELELKDKPEILTFILRLQEIIKKQAKKIKKLKTNLKHFVCLFILTLLMHC